MSILDSLRYPGLILATALGTVVLEDAAIAQPVQYDQLPACGGQALGFNSSALTWFCSNTGPGVTTQIAPGHVIGNGDTISEVPGDWLSTTVLNRALGITQGSILVQTASGVALLAPGTAGAEVFSAGSGANLITAVPEHFWAWSWDTNTVIQTGTVILDAYTNPTSATIDNVVTVTGGLSTPGATVTVIANGTSLSGCTALNMGTLTTRASCTGGATTLAAGSVVSFVVVSTSGTPDGAQIKVNYHIGTP